MPNLIGNTVVLHPKTGEPVLLGAGGPLPDWAAPLVGDHLVEGRSTRRGASAPAKEDPAAELVRLQARINALKAAIPSTADGGDEPPQDGPPPKGGAGSGAPAWRKYAASKNVEVAEDASREDVVAALEAAGVPTE